MSLLIWLVLAGLTVVLLLLTYQLLAHDPATCRTCVHRAATARARRPVPVEDRPEWSA